jgi:hypothetical protein
VAISGWFKKKFAQMQEESHWRAKVDRGLDEIIDAVDPRLRGLSGYKRRLEPAALRAYEYAQQCVQDIPAPIEVTRGRWGVDPKLRAYFASADAMQEVFDGSQTLRRFLTGAGAANAEQVFVGLGMRLDERKRLGHALHGDTVQRDVEQTTASFGDHNVALVASSEEELREQAVHRVLEELATRAMQRIMGNRLRKDSLKEQSAVLRWKLKIYERGSHGLGTLSHDEGVYERHAEELRQRLDETQSDLKDVLHTAGTIEDFMRLTIEVFDTAPEYISVEPFSLLVDDMNVKQDTAHKHAKELALTRVHVGRRRPRVVQLLCFSPDFVRVDTRAAIRKAARALGV